MSRRNSITQDWLKANFHYDPTTGIFTRLIARPKARAGSSPKTINDAGYLMLRIDGVHYRVHHLAYLYMTGELPFKIMDHLDGNRSNNKWENLRLVTPRENTENLQTAQKNSKSGVKGVSPHKSTGKWRAWIGVDRKHLHLGIYDNIESARSARLAAELKYYTHSPANRGITEAS